MEDSSDTLIIVLVLFGVGVAAWWLINRKPLAPAEPPCNVNVAYQGVGVGIPCGALKDIPKVVTGAATQTLKPLAGGVADALGFGSSRTAAETVEWCKGIKPGERFYDLCQERALKNQPASTGSATAPVTRTAAERSAILSNALGLKL